MYMLGMFNDAFSGTSGDDKRMSEAFGCFVGNKTVHTCRFENSFQLPAPTWSSRRVCVRMTLMDEQFIEFHCRVSTQISSKSMNKQSLKWNQKVSYARIKFLNLNFSRGFLTSTPGKSFTLHRSLLKEWGEKTSPKSHMACRNATGKHGKVRRAQKLFTRFMCLLPDASRQPAHGIINPIN